MFNRSAEKNLVKWLSAKRRKPLILRGARQVGKSTLIRMFARNAGIVLNEINLERHRGLDDLFGSTKTDQILREFEGIVGRNIRQENSLLFLDEIQATPKALLALRYLHEDHPTLPVIAAGSLLEFTLADHSFSMPVGRIEYLHLHPASFREFLKAVDPNLAEQLDKFSLETPLPDSTHQKLLDRQREYFFVGGMPEAVSVFKETQSLAEVSAVHRSIANTYQDDFSKYPQRHDKLLLEKIFAQIPRNLGRKVKYTNFDSDTRAAKIRASIEMLTKARVCHPVYHSHCNGVPLYADIKENTYKLLFMDIGLANHICGLDWLAVSSLTEQQLVNEGGMAEQFIGQHLVNLDDGLSSPRLCYWLREAKTANAEVDYVISSGNWIIPIEVKAGKSGSLKSLHHFVYQKGAKQAVRFDLNNAGSQIVNHSVTVGNEAENVAFSLISLPLYAVEFLPQLIKERRKQPCPKCGGPLEKRTGRHGDYLACTGYPKETCRYTISIKKLAKTEP